MSPDDPRLTAQLLDHEGLRTSLYTDTVGKLTIGVGRNLSDVGISKTEALFLLRGDLDAAIRDCERFPWFEALSPVRQRVVVDMRFNLGPSRLRTFTRTLAAIGRGDYETAAAGMLASKWARQVGRRAQRLATMMRTNKDPGAV